MWRGAIAVEVEWMEPAENARVRAQVEKWRDELLDLTGRNRLLRFRHTRTSSLEIVTPAAQETLDRLLTGRRREWSFHLPEEEPTDADLDPTASLVGLGARGASPSRALDEALGRLDLPDEGGPVWLSLGVLRWTEAATHSAALALVPAYLDRRGGPRLRLERHELVINPALSAHFEREHEVELGEGRYRIESAGVQEYLDQLNRGLAPLSGTSDDRIGLISAAQHEAMLAGDLDVTPRVLITEAPRGGVLAELAGLEEGESLPLLKARAPRRTLAQRAASSAAPGQQVHTTKRTAKEVAAACAGLSRRTTQEFMDKGLWILYLAVGMLHWSDPADGRAEAQDSPLLLVPVRIESTRRGAEWKLLAAEEEPLLNPALWMKLEGELGMRLPTIEEGEPIDVAALLAAVRAAVSGHPQWTVEERMVVSTFSFHKEVMYRDLRDNLERIVAHPVVSALADEPGTAAHAGFDFEPIPEERLDEDAPPEELRAILDADASQRQCIAAACAGRSFVMDGPPGTGKSQTIANMIAELIASGKTVLFVSEKAAALDVVHDRLQRVGLHEYALELHSHKTTRAAVAGALGQALMRKPRPRPSLAEGDIAALRRRREAVSAYALALNEPVQALGGRSLHHLLGWIAELQHLPQAPPAGRVAGSVEEIADLRELAQRLRGTWEVVERGEDFVWRGASASGWHAQTEQRVVAALDAAEAGLSGLRAVAEDAAADLLLDPPAGPRAARRLRAVIEHLTGRPAGIRAEWLTQPETGPLVVAAESLTRRIDVHRRAVGEAEAHAGARWRELPDQAPRLLAVERGLEAGAVTGAGALAAPGLRRLAGEAEALAGLMEQLAETGADLAAQMGLKSVGLELAHVAAAVRAAAVAQSADRPEAAWLTGALPAAREAHARLAPLVETVRETREAAAAFEPSALELDLDGLARRFRDEHRGLKKLGGAYRADRDALAATAPGVKPKAAIAGIDRAIAWQAAERALDAAVAGGAAAPLGARWQREGTDLERAAASLRAAEEVDGLVQGRVADAARLAAVVSGERPIGAAAGLAEQADSLLLRVRSATPEPLAAALAQPAAQAAGTLRSAAAGLATAADAAAAVDAVRGREAPLDSAIVALRAAAEAVATEQEHAADADGAAQLGAQWHALDADAGALAAAVQWAQEMRHLHEAPITAAAAGRLTAASCDPADLVSALERCDDRLAPLLGEFATERRAEVVADLEGHFGDAQALLDHLRATRGDIETWIAHAAAREALEQAGLRDALRYCTEHPVQAPQLVGVLRRSVLEAMADHLLAERAGRLGPLRAVDRDRLVAEFADGDRRLVADAAHRIMEAANRHRPNTILGVATIIANEAQKKRKHMPVSELLARTAPVAQAIKPCFMMSPLSVSQYLTPEMVFDVVIFDEASQVRPSDAVNALYRGRAMIVAGDQKQLPPTSFFEQSTDESDDWTEDSLAEFDSVLDLAKGSGAFRPLSLRWHYRSRHEHLIAFSNHRFYGGDLVTFPSPDEESHDLGVQLLPVEGIYRRGTSRDNPVEAQAVVERVFAHAERGSRSIGIVAFSEAQASLIEEALRRDARRDDARFASMFSDDRLEGLFVKNLENVQGDERDLIIFSVGYGPDEHGRLTMNFGPLNREGGWRRLNVAITRARKRVEVICSFAAEQLSAGSRTRGVDELRRYLEFAARGPQALAAGDGHDPGGEPESPFEEAVLRTVRGWGYDVVSQVGTAGFRVDLGVRDPDNPGRIALGIECDGAMYHSSRVARDRDRLREQVLLGLGWTLHRIWGPTWYRDRSGEERRLQEAIERALLAPQPVTMAGPPLDDVQVELDFDHLEPDARPRWAEPYAAANLPAATTIDPTEPEALPEVRQRILHVVTEEGPIVEDLLVRRVIAAWGAIVTERRRGAVGRVVKSLAASGSLVRQLDAYCLPTQRTDLVRVPDPADARSDREVGHIPQIELGEALIRMVGEARVVSDDELLRQTARLFGWKRTGPAIQAALTRAVEQLAAEGRLQREGATLRPVLRP